MKVPWLSLKEDFSGPQIDKCYCFYLRNFMTTIAKLVKRSIRGRYPRTLYNLSSFHTVSNVIVVLSNAIRFTCYFLINTP